MKSTTWHTAGLVMALIGAASIAQAQGRGNREEMTKKYDKDGDGKLSEIERATMREDMQAQRSAKEKSEGSEKKGAKGKSDGEGRSGPGGERPSAEETVKKYDKDGSGELSASELELLFKEQRERMQQRGGQSGPGDKNVQGRDKRGGQSGQGGRMNRDEIMKKYDADGDGQLSDEERDALRKDMQNRQGNR